jgi:hypothetical protein
MGFILCCLAADELLDGLDFLTSHFTPDIGITLNQKVFHPSTYKNEALVFIEEQLSTQLHNFLSCRGYDYLFYSKNRDSCWQVDAVNSVNSKHIQVETDKFILWKI